MTTWGIFLRGMLMGAADIVPGVSGGTMAFITGIYDRLLDSIRSFDIRWLGLLARADFGTAWRHVDGVFLLPLLLGIGTSILSLARLVSYVLEHHPVPLWAFFFGLILASAVVLMLHVDRWNVARGCCFVGGTVIALFIALAPVLDMGGGMPALFVAGFLAICAMILPGISGSFILVLLGMYTTVLGAIKSLDLSLMLVFAVGAGAGLMSFSRLLHWLLQRYHAATMALLTGFLFGSLAVVWPWKKTLEWVVGSHGELKPAQRLPVLPGDYASISGHEPLLPLCLAMMVLGFALVWLLDTRWGRGRAGG